MKLPNGYGSVYKLSGNRRKPYIARVTAGWDASLESGKAVQNRITIGAYKTRKEALAALADYAANPYDLDAEGMTLAELYEKWTESYFPTLSSGSSVRTVSSAWKYCHEISGMRVKDVRARHIKGVMENGYVVPETGAKKGEKVYATPAVKARIKSLFNLMLDFAVEYEIVDRNYARTFGSARDGRNDNADAEPAHVAFTSGEMAALWGASERSEYAGWVVMQCYMGWRPQEMARLRLADVSIADGVVSGGMKTEAGRNRSVPIHHRIMPLVSRAVAKAESLGSEFLLNDPSSPRGGMALTYDKYSARFQKAMDAAGISEPHRPHDPRKTFVTMAKKAGVDEYAIKRLVGHRISDITEAAYTDRDIEWMRSEVEKIP